MKKTFFLTAAILTITTMQPASAQGFLDRVNNTLNKVDQAIQSGERAQNTAERVMDKVPESEEQTQAAPAPKTVEPAAGGNATTAEEEEILRKAKEIEERRILEEAEKIKAQRAATSSNN